jgi:hypothetical protein
MRHLIPYLASCLLALVLLIVPLSAQAGTFTVPSTTVPCLLRGPIAGGGCPDGSYPCRRGNGPPTCDCPTI